MLKRTDAEARTLGMQLVYVEAAGAADLDRAFAEIGGARVDALVFSNPSPVLFGERKRVAGLAIAQRLPSMGNGREFVIDGGLMSYGPDLAASFRRAAAYAGRIAKGAKPADLAVERATTVELTVNLATAASIGLVVPPALLARADDVLR